MAFDGKAWRAANQERIKANRIRYYAQNKEHIKAKARKYAAENKSQIQLRNKLHRLANIESIRAREHARLVNFPEHYLFYSARRRAKQKGLEFALQPSDIVIPEMCPVLGIPLKKGTGCFTANSPSIDRIDNSRGYTVDNIVVVSFRANNLKNSASITELEAILAFCKRASGGSTS